MGKNTFYSLRDGYIITPHAIGQYISRWARGTREMDAKKDIQQLFNCLRNSGKTLKGDQVMISDLAPDIRFVFREKKVCVTVLPPRSNAALPETDPFEDDIPVNDTLYLDEVGHGKENNSLLLKELQHEEDKITKEREILKKRHVALGFDLDKVRAKIGRIKTKLRIAGVI